VLGNRVREVNHVSFNGGRLVRAVQNVKGIKWFCGYCLLLAAKGSVELGVVRVVEDAAEMNSALLDDTLSPSRGA
jgi:hypothetical protein